MIQIDDMKWNFFHGTFGDVDENENMYGNKSMLDEHDNMNKIDPSTWMKLISSS
jgi:hypothetical protein